MTWQTKMSIILFKSKEKLRESYRPSIENMENREMEQRERKIKTHSSIKMKLKVVRALKPSFFQNHWIVVEVEKLGATNLYSKITLSDISNSTTPVDTNMLLMNINFKGKTICRSIWGQVTMQTLE